LLGFPAEATDSLKIQMLEEEVRRLRSRLALIGAGLDNYGVRARLPRGDMLGEIYQKFYPHFKHNEAIVATLLYLKFEMPEILLMVNLDQEVVDHLIRVVFSKSKAAGYEDISEKLYLMIQSSKEAL
jgi:hypothetical protein